MKFCSKVLVIFSLLGLTAATGTPDFLGRSVYVPSQDLHGSVAEDAFYSSPVLKNIANSSCVRVSPVYQSGRYFTFYSDTASFYSSLTTNTHLSAELRSDFSLSTTLNVQSKEISGSEKTVTGNDLVIIAKSVSFSLDKSCIDPSAFTDGFIRDLNALPTAVSSPWLSSSWRLYDTFLKKYGSHVMMEITTGSEISQSSYASTSSSYSERDFQVKSCIGLAGPTEVGKMNVSLCANVTNEEINTVSSMKMSTTLNLNGGTTTTRNKLLQERTPELIEQFMNEANETAAPIRYKLISVWDLLKQSFIGVSDDFIRGLNLEYYYRGFLNYGCQYENSGGQDLQKFDFTNTSTKDNPDYECTLAPKGCHNDDDCHYHIGVWCACRGPSCVLYETTTLDTGENKTTAYINADESWGWRGCDWKVWASVCECYNTNTERVRVWPDNALQLDALYKAHNSMIETRKKLKILANEGKRFKDREDL